MIIGHRYKYLFIENPQTGSWAIRNELCNYCGGIPILNKHSTYPEFVRTATYDEKKYFVFATVRNPLDKLVSRYLKFRTDHRGVYSDPNAVDRNLADFAEIKKYEFVKDSNASFEDFFRKYYHRLPYGDFVDVSSDRFDFVIRYESLQDDFSEVLQILGIDQARAVPVMNKTRGKEGDWEKYYKDPEIIERAKIICGPYMKKWGYEFPSNWGNYEPSWFHKRGYTITGQLRTFYLIHFRYNDRFFGRLIRLLRSQIVR